MDILTITDPINPLDLTSVAGASKAKGGLVATYTNTSAVNQRIIGRIDINAGMNAAAATLSVFYKKTNNPSGPKSVPLIQTSKHNDADATQSVPIPETIVLAGDTMKWFLHSSNGSDSAVTAVAFLFNVQTGIDVLSVGGQTPESLNDAIPASPTADSVWDLLKRAIMNGRFNN